MFGHVSFIDPLTETPDLLGDNSIIHLRHNRYYHELNHDSLRLWCHRNARYGVPTVELIDWLKTEIGGRFAIEIGAGHGDLCHYLGIPGTDNYCQDKSDVRLAYKLMGQPVITYGEHVLRMDAETAIRSLRPAVVVASWVTQWIDPDLPPPDGGGNIYGVKEDDIIDSGKTYILIGNETVHGTKRIMHKPHVTLPLEFVRSRSVHPELNRVWIWNR